MEKSCCLYWRYLQISCQDGHCRRTVEATNTVAGLLLGLRSSGFSSSMRHCSSKVGSHPFRSLQCRVRCCGDPPGSRSKPLIPKPTLTACQSWAPRHDTEQLNSPPWTFERYFASSPGAALSLRRQQCTRQSSCCDCPHGARTSPSPNSLS